MDAPSRYTGKQILLWIVLRMKLGGFFSTDFTLEGACFSLVSSKEALWEKVLNLLCENAVLRTGTIPKGPAFSGYGNFCTQNKVLHGIMPFYSWDCISPYTQTMQLWAAAKRRWLHAGLSQLAPHFYLCSGGHAAVQLDLIQRKGKNCFKYKLKLQI